MAIIERLGLAVSVIVDGEALPEYDDPEPDARGTSNYDPAVTAICNKYIESKADAEYSFSCEILPKQKWLNKHKDNRLSFRVFIDGNDHGGVQMGTRYMKDGHTKDVIEGVRYRASGGEMLKKFKFDIITTTDNADNQTITADAKRAADIGVIRVEVRRRHYKGEKKRSNYQVKGANLSVAEAALKGKDVSHGTTFSVPKQVEQSTMPLSDDVDDHPIAVFNLMYRSKDALRREMIVPRTPSPSPAQVVEGLSLDDLRRLAVERLTELKVKEENGLSQSDVKPEIKRETQHRPVKREFAEAFDLTADADGNAGPSRPLKISRGGNDKETIDLTDD